MPTQKCPLDLWIYQELLYELRPDLIIETGTYSGGSAMYLASICDLLDHGRIVSVDIAPQDPLPSSPAHRVRDRRRAPTPSIVERLRGEAAAAATVMVLLDSDHSYAHVRDELVAYHAMVTPGSYLVVEDSNVNGNPVLPEFGPGPMEAIDEFLPDHPEFDDRRPLRAFHGDLQPARIPASPELSQRRIERIVSLTGAGSLRAAFRSTLASPLASPLVIGAATGGNSWRSP